MRKLVLLVCSVVLHAQPALNLKNLDLDAVDRSAKPCADFYQYSIGKWHAKHPILPAQTRWGKRWAGADGNLETLKSIADEFTKKRSSPGTDEQLIGDFYAACLDTATIDARGSKPIQDDLAKIAAIRDRPSLQQVIAQLQNAGVDVPFALAPTPDSHDPRNVIAGIYADGLGLPDRDYYLKTDKRSEDTRKRYLEHVAKLLGLAGFDAGKAQAAAKTVLEMETKLATEQLSRVELRDPHKVSNNLSPEKLRELMPGFDWAQYYKTLSLRLEGVAEVADLKYMKEVDRQLGATSLEDWKTYLTWHVVRESARHLSAPFRDEMFAFEDAYLGGAKEPKPRWKFCIAQTDRLISDPLGRAYVAKVFPPAAKARMQELVKYLLAAMKDSINGLEWMTPATKQKAFEKLTTFDPKVGYPDRWRDFSSIAIRSGEYWQNRTNAIAFQTRDALGQIGKPVDRTRWGMTPPTSNAYYNPMQNEIVFPAGILVPPMFGLDADDAVNYGAIGVVIGHEISHGFDDSGSEYDAQGRLRNWWTVDDKKQFEQRTACVVNQFNGYLIEPGVAHNGKLVLGESIGDLAGARIAYLAYMKSLEGKPRNVIDGFTPEQRFFLAWGQARGDAIRIEQQRIMVVTDPHPVAKYRVNGPLSNMPEFMKAFGCGESDPMVRSGEKRCRIW